MDAPSTGARGFELGSLETVKRQAHDSIRDVRWGDLAVLVVVPASGNPRATLLGGELAVKRALEILEAAKRDLKLGDAGLILPGGPTP